MAPRLTRKQTRNTDSWSPNLLPRHRELSHKLDVLRAHCERLGRNYDKISKTVGGFFYTGQPASEIIDQVRPMAELGFDHVTFNVFDDYQGTPVERLGTEVVPALAEL